MKKTLAILLALLMVGSIVLVSCDGGRTPIGDGFDDEDNDEEPEHGKSVYGDAEEPSPDSLAELLSVFNAIRPNY